jgi:zinc transport system permease protein
MSMTSLVEFCLQFPEAVACGLIMSVTCGVFGVFVLLRRMVFISIALSECAACGIAAASLWHISPLWGAAVSCLVAVLFLAIDWENARIPRDAVLGTVFAAAAAGSVLIVAKSGFGLMEVKALLYGDLILATWRDAAVLLGIHLPLLALCLLLLKPILYTFIDRNAAQVLGIPVRCVEYAFFLALGLVVSAAGQTGGAILIFSYLVVVPTAALGVSRRLAVVLALSTLLGLAATMAGFTWSYQHDLPGNQCIIMAACLLSAAVTTTAWTWRWCARRRMNQAA